MEQQNIIEREVTWGNMSRTKWDRGLSRKKRTHRGIQGVNKTDML